MPWEKPFGKRHELGCGRPLSSLTPQEEKAVANPGFACLPSPVRCLFFILVINTVLLSIFTFRRTETFKHVKNIFCCV